MKRSMITNQALINQSRPAAGMGQPIPKGELDRRGAGRSAFSPSALSPRRVMAQGDGCRGFFRRPVEGVYEPVVHAPDLGLSMNLG